MRCSRDDFVMMIIWVRYVEREKNHSKKIHNSESKFSHVIKITFQLHLVSLQKKRIYSSSKLFIVTGALNLMREMEKEAKRAHFV